MEIRIKYFSGKTRIIEVYETPGGNCRLCVRILSEQPVSVVMGKEDTKRVISAMQKVVTEGGKCE